MTRNEFWQWSDRLERAHDQASLAVVLDALRQLPEDEQRQDLLRMAHMIRVRLP